MKIFLIVFISCLLVIYLMAAFITLQFNPANWSIEARATSTVIGVLISGVIATMVWSDKVND